MGTKTRFEEEAKGNSEMAYYHKDTFSLTHINACSINKNIETIHQMLSSLRISFDIIGISETWISEPNDLIQIENYKLICNRRKNRKRRWCRVVH